MTRSENVQTLNPSHAPNRIEGIDTERIRADFPALGQSVHGKPLVYLDNAATAQKPLVVVEALRRFYEKDCANVHRGIHELSVRATESYEAAREAARRFVNAPDSSQIVFVRGATEGINLVAQAFVRPRLRSGDEILVTEMEHHSNIVPWQILCDQAGAVLRVVPIDDRGALMIGTLDELVGERTRLVAVTHASNALGTINPLGHIIQFAHSRGVPVLVDGAQAAPHLPIDVQALECDFYAFSGHKVYGPTGIGVLYGRTEHLEAMPPYQGGGEMIRSVTFERTLYGDSPFRFEAGTPNIAGAVGLAAALEYVTRLGQARICAHEETLFRRATAALAAIERVRLIGTARRKTAIVSFAVDGVHPHDVGTVLDREGVAVRAGHHCAQPVMERFGVAATTRASFGLYNTAPEVDALAAGVRRAIEVLS